MILFWELDEIIHKLMVKNKIIHRKSFLFKKKNKLEFVVKKINKMSCDISKDKLQNPLNEIGTKTYHWVRIGQINRNIKTGSLVWNS